MEDSFTVDADIHELNHYFDKFFLLKIYLGDIPSHIYTKYSQDIANRQKVVHSYIKRYYMSCSSRDNSLDHIHIDAGFDLYVPTACSVKSKSLIKINTQIKSAMYYDSIPCGFYLYPRSSTGSKTPLRLANSVGVIDSGYRGDCIAVFDNNSESAYEISSGDRLVQICGGNLLYPIYPVIVDTIEELGVTSRGSNGFGSTGD